MCSTALWNKFEQSQVRLKKFSQQATVKSENI